MKPRLHARGVTVRPIPGSSPLVEGVDLLLHSGQAVGISGRSGSGKSTLLGCLSGLVPWARAGESAGSVLLDGEEISDLDPAQRARHMATCLDRPEAQLFLSTPRQEVEAARALHAPAPLCERLVELLGVSALLDRRTVELSSGERQRVALATALAAAPKVVLLDEPCAHLDDDGVAHLAAAIGLVTSNGGAVLVVEQAGWRLGRAVESWFELRGGALVQISPPAPPSLPPPVARTGKVVLATRALAIRRSGRELLRDVDIELRAGEVVVLSGKNGSGKSSLARVLAGHAVSAGIAVARGSAWLRRPETVALAMPDAGLQLFEATVAREIGLAGPSAVEASDRLRRHRLETLAARAPWTLSRGERQRLLHAALDALEPTVVVIDEPGQGLDPQDIEDLAALVRERAASGRAYLLMTHRREFATLAHRHVTITAGSITETLDVR